MLSVRMMKNEKGGGVLRRENKWSIVTLRIRYVVAYSYLLFWTARTPYHIVTLKNPVSHGPFSSSRFVHEFILPTRAMLCLLAASMCTLYRIHMLYLLRGLSYLAVHYQSFRNVIASITPLNNFIFIFSEGAWSMISRSVRILCWYFGTSSSFSLYAGSFRHLSPV